MESDRREPCSPGLADEQARERLRVEWPAVLGRDDQARVGVVGTPGQPLGGLTGAAQAEPAGAPNVVVVVDDMGVGASSAFGGPCRMPTAERLG